MKLEFRYLLGLIILPAVLLAATSLAARAADPGPATASGAPTMTHYVAARVPVQGTGRELSADRPASPGGGFTVQATRPYSNAWQLQATLSGAVIKDISFGTDQVGYIAAEQGQVWKTTNGGANWTRIVNLGFPYYWYGVYARDANTVAITGFINNNYHGILRWSTDGGATWTPDQVLTTTGWSYRIRFADALHGLVVDGVDLQAPNRAHYTTNGGWTAGDWTPVVPDPSPNGGWFWNQFSLLPNLKARVAGITYCTSPDAGATWGCRASIDSVFDGPVFFAQDDQNGWVGGGSISPTVEGWVHRTTDGGATWSGRTLDGPWPIREIRFLDAQTGWAAGGNIYSASGGLYYSSDGGQTWSVDLDSGIEMDACDSRTTSYGQQVWCAGYNSSFNGKVYTLQIGTPPTATPSPPPPTATATPVATSTPVPPTPCTIQFTDVPPGSTFYAYVRCLACRGILGGYSDGTFRPGNNITRGQLAKIVSNSAGFSDPAGAQLYEDVPPANTFFDFVQRLSHRGVMGGYACGGVGEPCVPPGNLPYFRPNNNATRGQIAKIDVNAGVIALGWTLLNPPNSTFEDVATGSTFFQYVETAVSHGVMGGYACGAPPAGPCVPPGNKPYFLPNNNATRGQTAKIVANTFFPACETPARR